MDKLSKELGITVLKGAGRDVDILTAEIVKKYGEAVVKVTVDGKEATIKVVVTVPLESISVDKDSRVFHYLTRIQDEVHRFTINYHKTLRSKGSISSILDNIEGIGSVRKKELIKKYGNINNIKNASIEELSQIIPEGVAMELKKYLEAKDEAKKENSNE